MKPSLLNQKRPICKLCRLIASEPRAHFRRPLSSLLRPSGQASFQTRTPQRPRHFPSKLPSSISPLTHTVRSVSYEADVLPIAEDELEAALSNMEDLLESDTVPSEPETIEVLQLFEVMGMELMGTAHSQASPAGAGAKDKQTPASVLLSLDPRSAPPAALSPAVARAVDTISKACFEIMSHPIIFIDRDVLETYVRVQSLLQRPETFPEVFRLYATKPLAIPGTSPPSYQTPNPKRAKFAIPAATAETALQTAIAVKDLPLAMDIIGSSYAAPAFRRAKFIRKAMPPLIGAALSPVAAYTIAMQLSEQQNSMDLSTARNIAFTGILAYLGFTATMGVVALTTAKETMDRVTWAPGVPLRERWIREEERAAIDRLAQAWGFKESWKRGEEEGPEWEALREWVGFRNMILDRAEFLEGME